MSTETKTAETKTELTECPHCGKPLDLLEPPEPRFPDLREMIDGNNWSRWKGDTEDRLVAKNVRVRYEPAVDSLSDEIDLNEPGYITVEYEGFLQSFPIGRSVTGRFASEFHSLISTRIHHYSGLVLTRPESAVDTSAEK